MIRRLIILLLIVGCEDAPTDHTHDDDKIYKCEIGCEYIDPPINFFSCDSSPIQVDAFDIDEAEEYCYDWYEIESLNSTSVGWINYSCSCEFFK